MQTEYHILFPKMYNNLNDADLTFVINHMKCRTVAVVYFLVHCYDTDDKEIKVANKPAYVSQRWVVDTTYSQYMEEFTLPDPVFEKTNTLQIDVVAINISDNNPLWFNQCMLTDKLFTQYHKRDEALEIAKVNLIKNGYANLYSNNTKNYLQVIRPSKKAFTTNTLVANDITVLAPHIPNEPQIDAPINIFVEFLNQDEQTTDIALDTFKM